MTAKTTKILFQLPVTKKWLEQYALVNYQLGLSYREILYGLKTLFNTKRSIGWAYNVLHKNSEKAAVINSKEDLSGINISANDELFNHNKPVLTSVCTHSLYCPLLQKENYRDAITWAIRLLELVDKGYSPQSVILDGLNSLNAGHKLALEDVNIIYDTFHIIKDSNDLKRFVNNQLKSSRTNLNTIIDKLDRAKDAEKIKSLLAQKKVAQTNYDQALQLHQSIATLCSWLQHDILVVAGSDYATRLELLEFITEELEKLEPQLAHRIKPVRTTLQNKPERILGFLKDLENEFISYADEINCDVYWLWELCNAQRYSKDHAKYYQTIAKARSRFKHHFHEIEQTVVAIMDEVEKASSVVENLNGRIRKFLINHVHVSQELLDLLRFVMNHTEFSRSRCEHREGKSPAQVMNDAQHPHWLELLGYDLFKKAA